MPGLSLTWTKIVGPFQLSEFVQIFMDESVLEKDAQQQQHISTPNIRVNHIGNSASQANRGGAGQHKRRSASADAVAAHAARSEAGSCGHSEAGPCGRSGRAEAGREVPGGAAAGAEPNGGVSADGVAGQKRRPRRRGGRRGAGDRRRRWRHSGRWGAIGAPSAR